MKRVTQGGDINFNVADVRGLGENYAFRFYTTDSCKYIVKVDGDAVDGIIRLEWEELKTLGDGVLNYCGENLEPDEEYSDATFNRTFGGTTQWYIVTSCGGSGTSEEITELSDRLDAEIERSTEKDEELQNAIDNTYTQSEIDQMVANAGKVKAVSINNEIKLPDQTTGVVDLGEIHGEKGDKGDKGEQGEQGPQGEAGTDGITPHIDVVTGNWFIGDTDTEISARGLQGNSGYTGAVGELEVVEDYTEGGVGKALSAEAGKMMAIQSIPCAGSFADAYDKALENNVVFPWFLRDVDKNGNPVEKMIWHNGYHKFVDAIGSEVNGHKNGLTITVNNACDMKLGPTSTGGTAQTYPLTLGENNFSFADLGWDGTTAINEFNIYESGTTTDNKNYVEEIDFGGLKFSGVAFFLNHYDSLKKIKRLDVEQATSVENLSNMAVLEEIQMTGVPVSFQNRRKLYRLEILKVCPKLVKADLKGFQVEFAGVNGFIYSFKNCGRLEYVDIRDIDTTNATSFLQVFQNCSKLKTLIIGNFSNESITNKTDAFSGVTDCVLICTKSTPPKLKNCSFTDSTPNDEYSIQWDWLAYNDNGVTKCRFSAIYVPSDAVTAYKTNTYVENGTVGNTGWSKYADIIKDIAEYNG